MTRSTTESPSDSPDCFFDVPTTWPGPVTRARLRRSRTVYAVIATVGFGLGIFGPSAGWKSFGLGLVLPGGGFLHHLAGGPWQTAEHLLLAVVSGVVFAVAVVLWWWCGVVGLPVVVWLAAAVVAATMGHDDTFEGAWALVAALVAVIVAVESRRKAKLRRQIRTSAAANAAGAARAGHADLSPPDRVAELSAEDLALMRFALDRALQPVSEFNGFHFGDQWQLSATRYQVFTLGWALALANGNHLPAMRGYLQQAQLNLLEKTRDPRLWSYWKWENLWGNFTFGADPIKHDNIMFSGYVGQQFGCYQAATGDLRHDTAGAYTLVDKRGRSYVYDVPKLVEILTAQYASASFGAWPCEPNWVYLFCNTTGGNAIKAFDAAHGTDHWGGVADRFDRYITQEFTRPDGFVTELRSTYTGFTPPLTNGPITNMNAAAGLHALAPRRAEGLWWLSRDHVLETRDGVPRIQARHIKRTADPGNLKRTPGFSFGMMLHAAREFGDDEFATAVCTEIDHHVESSIEQGTLSYAKTSIWGHALLLMGTVGRKNGLRDLVSSGVDKRILDGPQIIDAPYPEVLVARATSDGVALDAVLYPGVGARRVTLTVGQLIPGRAYTCECATEVGNTEIIASADGTATLAVDVDQRTPLRLMPVV